MELKFSYMEKAVGAFVLLILVVLLAGMAMISQGKGWFRKHVPYYATFREGYNLEVGSKVKFLQTDIGEVRKVSLTDDNRVRVDLRVLALYAGRIKTDSLVQAKVPPFLGSGHLAITPGSPQAQPLEPGSQITSRESRSLADILEEADAEARLQRMGEIIDNLAKLSAALSDPQGPLMASLGSAQRMAQNLEQGKGTMGRLISDDEFYRQIRKQTDQVGVILASVEEITRQTAELVPRLGGQMEQMMARLQKTLDSVEAALKDLPELTQQGRETMSEVRQILHSVKQNFFIRSNLPPAPTPSSHGSEIRGD